MKKIILCVERGDEVADLSNALQALSFPGVHVRITAQSQVNDIWTPNGATIAPFEGTIGDVLSYLEERCHDATGYPDSTHRCKFVFPTTVEITK